MNEYERLNGFLHSIGAGGKSGKEAAPVAAVDFDLTEPQQTSVEYVAEQIDDTKTLAYDGRMYKVKDIKERFFDVRGNYYLVVECTGKDIYIKIDRKGRPDYCLTANAIQRAS